MLKLPHSFKEKYINLLGKKNAEDFFISLNIESKKAFRVNSLKYNQKISYDKSHPIVDIPHAYYGEVSGQDPEWVSGTVYSQDPAAMFPAEAAEAQPGQKILDLCAAPGGKTTALGEALKGQGILVANEISNKRVKILRENIERWGINNSLITNNDTAVLSKKFPHFFDKILVDAPCSGEGMFRKNHQAVNYWSLSYIEFCQKRQKKILEDAITMLKPTGKLIYSTCTFSPEENEEIVYWLVKKYNMNILPIKNIHSNKIKHGNTKFIDHLLPDLKNTLRFWPQDNIGEGQFVAVLQMPKFNLDKNNIFKIKKNKKEISKKSFSNKEEKKLIQEVLNQFELPKFLIDWKSSIQVSQNHVFLPAISTNYLYGLKIINNGIELGILKKKRFEPGHQLAEALSQVKQERVIDLNIENLKKYLHGETIKINSNLHGFVLVSAQGKIFSFGKIAGNGILKNFYPKGLRI